MNVEKMQEELNGIKIAERQPQNINTDFTPRKHVLAVKKLLSEHVGLENLITVKEICASENLRESVARGAIEANKKHFRKDGFKLENGHIGHKMSGSYRTGYFIMRRDSKDDSNFVIRRRHKRSKTELDNLRDVIDNFVDWEKYKDRELYQIEHATRELMLACSTEIVRRKKKKDAD